MNILLITYDYPPHTGGIANVTSQIAHQLYKMEQNIIVVAQSVKGDKEFDKNNKFPSHRCINIFFLRELALMLLLPYLVLKYKIDIIYLLFWCQGGIATFLTSKILKKPYILHAYGEEFVDYRRTFLDRVKYGLFRQNYKRLIFRNANEIIAISNYTKEIVIKSAAIENRVDVIKCGVDIDRFRPDLDTSEIILKYRLQNKRILLTVSRLKRYKGHDIIINLMPQLLQRIPNLIYMIIGEGSDRDYLESLVKKLNLQNYVIFIGFVDELDLPLYYNLCDIYIMLTKERHDTDEFEGFGLVFLEANSCCKPVIGAKTGGIPEAIIDGKTGFLVDPINTHEIMDKIILLLQNRELAKAIGEEGRNRILRENFSWESMCRKINDVLTSEVKK